MNKANHLYTRLRQQEKLLLDGAMGTEILRRGIPTTLPLWSAEALLIHPQVVQNIHEDYIRCGAQIIITDTFRTTRRQAYRLHRRFRSPSRRLLFTRTDPLE